MVLSLYIGAEVWREAQHRIAPFLFLLLLSLWQEGKI